MKFTAFYDIFANEVYRGTMALITCNEHHDVYDNVCVVSYVKRVL